MKLIKYCDDAEGCRSIAGGAGTFTGIFARAAGFTNPFFIGGLALFSVSSFIDSLKYDSWGDSLLNFLEAWLERNK
ncbi:MAG: hypothetical protein WBA22_19605 [Candidatus Methanofastidiosia archaeon]